MYNVLMNFQKTKYQFAVQGYRYVIGCIWCGIIWYFLVLKYTASTHRLPWFVSWTFALSTQWPVSWNITWLLSWYTFGNNTYSINIEWTWTIWDDTISFDSMKLLHDWVETYIHYGSVHYLSQSQTWLSQLLHQYFWLWDVYEDKRYMFWSGSPMYSIVSSMIQQYIDILYIDTSYLWLNRWEIIIRSKPTGIIKQLEWTVSYGKKRRNNILIDKPKKTLSWSIFLETFIWTWATLVK